MARKSSGWHDLPVLHPRIVNASEPPRVLEQPDASDRQPNVLVASLRGQIGQVRDLCMDPRMDRIATASSGLFGIDNVARLLETDRAFAHDRMQVLHERAVARRGYEEMRRLFRTAAATLQTARDEIKGTHRLDRESRQLCLDRFDLLLPSTVRVCERARNIIGNPSVPRSMVLIVMDWARKVEEHLNDPDLGKAGDD